MPKNVVIKPLRKRTLTGELYTRDPAIEALLAKLSLLPQRELITRATISQREDPDYIPSECLVYFLRASRADNAESWYAQIYKILVERVLRVLPEAKSRDGKSEWLTWRSAIREKTFEWFVDLLVRDCATYCERLDYYEVKFDSALARLRTDAERLAWRDKKEWVPFEYEGGPSKLAAAVEREKGHFDLLAEIEDADDRLRLDKAIDALPPEQRRIIEMLRQGIPIDSKEPGAVTIAKTLKRSEKTVRTYRDKAVSTLRAALKEGDQR